jgi:hypothetical protein
MWQKGKVWKNPPYTQDLLPRVKSLLDLQVTCELGIFYVHTEMLSMIMCLGIILILDWIVLVIWILCFWTLLLVCIEYLCRTLWWSWC